MVANKKGGNKMTKYTETLYDGGRPFQERELNELPVDAKKISETEWERFVDGLYPTRIRRND